LRLEVGERAIVRTPLEEIKRIYFKNNHQIQYTKKQKKYSNI